MKVQRLMVGIIMKEEKASAAGAKEGRRKVVRT